MDTTIHQSLRRTASFYWPGQRHNYVNNRGPRDPYDFRPALNLRVLISSLSLENKVIADGQDHPVNGEPSTTDRHGKRKRTESPHGPSKRVKLGRAAQNSRVKLEEIYLDEIDLGHRQIYPSYWQTHCDVIDEVHPTEEISFLPVHQFTLSLRYNKVAYSSDSYVDDTSLTKWGWLKEEEKLCSLLELRQGNEPLDLGNFFMTRYCGRLLALSRPPPKFSPSSPEMTKEYSERWLFLLPDIRWPDDITEDDLREQEIQPSGVHRDFITACAVLQSRKRAKLAANLQLHILPEGTYNPTSGFPFELRAHFVLSLAIPKVYDPIPQSQLGELEGLQRRLLSFLSKTPFMRPVLENPMEEATDATIPFFLSVMRPAPPLAQDVNYESLQPDGLLSTLMPFQRRTVAWMLEREGKRVTPLGTVVPFDVSEASSSTASKPLELFWEEIEMGGRKFFFNCLTNALSPTPPEPHRTLGGILAEEPGLGKTMECLSLMLLNPAPERNPSRQRWDPEVQLNIKEIKTTLIVTPPALASQWTDELAAHAPDLKVFVYQGWAKVRVPISEADVQTERAKLARKSRSKGKAKQNGKGKANNSEPDDVVMDDSDAILDWPNFINQFDVCITTYKVLQTDMFVARVPPDRPRRQDVEYQNLKRRSPLVMCEWYRVIMDEVQMMGAGRSEEMVSLVPRLSSFAVSGTPARAQVSDLLSVLRFLRIDDLVTPKRIWNRLLKHRYKHLFVSLVQKYSVRTLKSCIKNELTIPRQQRFLVGIELGQVERHVYDHALGGALAELGLDARGVAAYEGWQVDAGVLRNVLRRLRGICTHPQIGQLPKQGDRLNKPGGLKTIADVLGSMKDQNWRNWTEDRKTKILALTRLAQLQQRCDHLDRHQRALEYLLTAEKEATQLIDEIKACVAEHHVKGEVLKEETQGLRNRKEIKLHDDQYTDKGKGKERERDRLSTTDLDGDDDDGDEDVEDRGLPKTPAGEEHRAKRLALLARLRECLMVLHRVKFLQGDVYHILGALKEDAAYADAESLRKDLLKSTEEAANKAMRRLNVAVTERRVTARALEIPLPFLEGGGAKSAHLFEEANEIVEEILNEQSALLWEWRAKIVGLLTRKLNAAGEQADGEEYARTLDTQGDAETYLQAYAALLADRRETIAAERTLLAAHEGREKKTRKTRAAARAKFQSEDMTIPEDIEVQPQLYAQLLEQRLELRLSERALKSVMVDLSAVAARIPKDDDMEKIIAKDGAARLRALIASLQELTDKLDADLAVLRKVFNDRIVYFRQLQEISDTVAEVQWEGDLLDVIDVANRHVADLAIKINTNAARQRYLEHLSTGKSFVDDDGNFCILCHCNFLRGFITHCAHMYCEDCVQPWIAAGKMIHCPVCRVPFDPSQMQRFSVQEDQSQPKPELNKEEPAPVSRREIQYNMIDPALFADIQKVVSIGSYGSKIQTLVRHLLHIQLVDPGAKSIVFSAWADSLTIVEHALHSNGKSKAVWRVASDTVPDIPCIRLDHNQGRGKDGAAKRFRVDPVLQVLLLHGERDNAGLNVTCASRVFLLESVVNHGFEVQAIARIDRLGQTRATEVFCYYTKDTVEKNILDLAAKQGLSLYTKDNSAGSVNVTSFATDSAKKLVDAPNRSGKKGQPSQKGDFIFKVNDMLAILFPHMFEDVEHLLPPDAGPEDAPSSAIADAAPVRLPARRVYVNAEAGPSRLPGS